MVACLFADDFVLLAGSARELHRALDEIYRVCLKRMLRVNVGKIEGMVFERREEVCD